MKKKLVVKTSGVAATACYVYKTCGAGRALSTVHFWQLRNHVQNCNFYEMVSVYESPESGGIECRVAVLS
jgi:hypothetical protein